IDTFLASLIAQENARPFVENDAVVRFTEDPFGRESKVSQSETSGKISYESSQGPPTSGPFPSSESSFAPPTSSLPVQSELKPDDRPAATSPALPPSESVPSSPTPPLPSPTIPTPVVSLPTGTTTPETTAPSEVTSGR